jgi:hypothetical protein
VRHRPPTRRTLVVVAGVLALALVVSGVALAALPKRGAHYAGRINDCSGIDCGTVDIYVSRKTRRRLNRLDARRWSATCDSSDSTYGGNNVYEGGTRSRNLRVRRTGRFSGGGGYSDTPPSTYGGPSGLTAQVTFTVSGRFVTERKAVGRYSVDVELFDSSGTRRDHCTDSERWVARKR